MLHCPDAENVDDIRRLEEIGVTDLQVAPWTLPSILAELGVSSMRVQPPLAVKQEAIKRYAEDIIAKCSERSLRAASIRIDREAEYVES